MGHYDKEDDAFASAVVMPVNRVEYIFDLWWTRFQPSMA